MVKGTVSLGAVMVIELGRAMPFAAWVIVSTIEPAELWVMTAGIPLGW